LKIKKVTVREGSEDGGDCLMNKPLHISFHRFGSGTVVTTAMTSINSINEMAIMARKQV